ncbi:MAG: GDP-mannose 4,6-dehydratase [candidate division WOR-3 bacterium]|nr:GDP-mannose 4,6-dehydratase [candidate division WOR-3 bacterium]MDW7987743.1 GDP-mannose 4,6-dehydratase [candidate division WOR-3 bacterium]
MKRILITGIEGFVGNHLLRFLRTKKYKIYGMHYKPCQLDEVIRYHGDIRDYSWVLKVIEDAKPTVIFHLAAQSSVAYGEKERFETFSINVTGTFNVLEAVYALGINSRIIYVSSCEVYGIHTKKVTEKSLLKPVSFYATTKICAENLCHYYNKIRGLDVIILRPFSHTGPGQSEQFIFPRIARKIVEIEKGMIKPVIEVGNLNLKRDYTDVRDIVRAYELAMNFCKSGEVYNITSGKLYTLKTGVDYLLSLTNKKIDLRINKSLFRRNDIPLLTGSAQKFIRLTGWQPKIDFFTTLKDLLEYYRQNLKVL